MKWKNIKVIYRKELKGIYIVTALVFLGLGVLNFIWTDPLTICAKITGESSFDRKKTIEYEYNYAGKTLHGSEYKSNLKKNLNIDSLKRNECILISVSRWVPTFSYVIDKRIKE